MENKNETVLDLLEQELLDKQFIHKPIDREILSKVDVVGFDIDHTLSIYNTEPLLELLYTCFARFLVEYRNYPKRILIYSKDNDIEFKEKEKNLLFKENFVHTYSSTEIILDLKNGNAISIDENKRVIQAFHGTSALSHEEVETIYGKEKEFSEFSYESKGENYQMILGNFEAHFIPLFLICVHLYDMGEMKHLEGLDYAVIYNNIFEALLFNYSLYDTDEKTIKDLRKSGYFYPELTANPKKYLYDYSAKEMLKHMKSKGVGVFFATNSFFEYGDFIMRNTIGDDYLDYFDLGFYFSKKPSFFDKNTQCEAHFPDLKSSDQKVHPGITPESLKDPEVFKNLATKKGIIEGNYKIAEEFFKIHRNKENLKFIYVGDNFFSDCYHPAKLDNWESIAITEHISTGFIGSKPSDIKKVWEVESYFGLKGEQRQNVFFTKVLREATLFSVSNVETLKYLK